MKELKDEVNKYLVAKLCHKPIQEVIKKITVEELGNKIIEICTAHIKGKEELISIFLEPYIKSHYQKSDVKDIAKDIINILIGDGK
jgi:hypothetical protein